MQEKPISPELIQRLQSLQEKYDAMGQDMHAYLEGLQYANFLNYWDYIHLDTLLSLQQPRTDFPDEKIFIIYHQITELYFNLVLWEMEQMALQPFPDQEWLARKINRVICYYQQLVSSFDIMVDGMEREQFRKFRMALLPSSGFQSVQYRKIEIRATSLFNLLDPRQRRGDHARASVADLFPHLYWKTGATELATGKKTLTLTKFEETYGKSLQELAGQMVDENLYTKITRAWGWEQLNPELVELLRQFDHLANVQWPLAHFRSAAKYLQQSPEVISATGGTNWQAYLPPKQQLIMFFPNIWSETEKNNWGKSFTK